MTVGDGKPPGTRTAASSTPRASDTDPHDFLNPEERGDRPGDL